MNTLPKEILKLIESNLDSATCTLLHFTCVEFSKIFPIKMPKNACIQNVVKYGNINLVSYLINNNCKITSNSCKCAAKYGPLEMINFLKEINCPEYENLINVAAKYGQLGMLKHLHENCLYSWDATTCTSDSINGHLECLK